MTTSKKNSSIVNTINAVAENIFYNKEGVENISISASIIINDEQKSDTAATATAINKIDTTTTSTTDSIENVNSKLIKINQESTKIILFNNKILNHDNNKSSVIHKIEKSETNENLQSVRNNQNDENFQKNDIQKIIQIEKCDNLKLDENNFIPKEDNHDIIALQNDKENLKKSKIIGKNLQTKVHTAINLTAKLSENNKNLKPLRSSSISSSSTTIIADNDYSEINSVKVLQNQNNSNISTDDSDKSKRHDHEINKNESVTDAHDGSYTNSNFVMDLSSNSNYNNVSYEDAGAENGGTEEGGGYGGGIIFNTSDIESHVVPVDPSTFSSNITSPVPPIKRRKRSNWNSETEKAFVKYWQQYYVELKKSKRTSIVYQKIADKLNKFGLSLTSRDVQVKTHNMTQKYRHERKLMYQSDGKPSNWPVYNEVHELIGHLYKDDAKLEATSSKDEIKPDKFAAGPSSPKIAKIEPDIPHLEVLKSLGQFGALSHLSSLRHFAPFNHLGAFGAYDNLAIKREEEEEDYVMDKDINQAPDSPNSSSTSDNAANIPNYDNDNNISIACEKRNNFIYNDNMPSVINNYNLNSNKNAQDHTIIVTTTNTDSIANTMTTTNAAVTANAVTAASTTTTTITTSATGTANSTTASNNDNFQDFNNIKRIKKRSLNREILNEIKKLNKRAREDSEYSNKLIAEANQIELKKLSVIEEYVRRSLQIQEKMLEIEIQRWSVN